ncbi:enoyl-CoA hydratase [Gonapodya prolifera JEL478]|uniref:Enoyl-CoA hydratase n=1 Tax=Gonapodya prolifera (strain JEL478) TaxID=1344416 RepID=A0A139AN75_GONPJ|nr:enoyl-CoA hydratase [Gonapodya prolifera JEL478]|eukprot:KXS18201.1 enoyl-CoA hydratase [Gonapodya prolifera JEL478]
MFDYTVFTNIKVEIRPDGIAILTLNRPERMNSWNDFMAMELIIAFEELDNDPNVKAIIVAGAGRAFCAGADLSPAGARIASARRVEHIREHRDSGGQVTARIARCRKLVVAAIHGAAVGVGITMTLPMDIRLIYRGAKIGFVFVRRGILPEAASSYFLPQLIGKSRTQALFMPGRVLNADHHLFNGLFFDYIDSPEKVLPAAIELVQEIVQNSSVVSIALTKAMVWHDRGSPEGQHLLDSKGILYTGNGADSREGTSSFLEKRYLHLCVSSLTVTEYSFVSSQSTEFPWKN